MANLITGGRLLLLFLVVAMIERAPVALAIPSMLLIVVVFAGDGLDGWVARRRRSASRFGAILDIAGDRVVETVLWIVFAEREAIPIWVPILVVTRGALVDALRSASYAEGMTAFGEQTMMRSALTRWLTGGRFMRGLYGYAKAAAFVFLTGQVAYASPEAAGTPIAALYGNDALRAFGWFWVWLSVALLIVRGVPVVVDAVPYLRGDAARPARAGSVAAPRSSEARVAPGRRGSA